MSLMGYTIDDVMHALESIDIAYEIIDVPADVDKGLKKAVGILSGLIAEGRV